MTDGGHTEEFGPWAPLAPAEAAALLGGAPWPWWIAGGWAIDLFVGRQTRRHGDLDVQVRRRDQHAAHATLVAQGWELHAADPPGTLRPWAPGETLGQWVHDIWCRPAGGAPWGLQLMLLDTEGERWTFRRNPHIGGALRSLGRRSAAGIPYLAPEVQLLYKAKPHPRPKDEADFRVALPLLDETSRAWLAGALERYNPDHPWLQPLRCDESRPSRPEG
ncbi:MAG TPA: amino acid transporter [Chloroflexota bacterium]|nr:amino acid transporter [Chloroflexota bacterium]